MLGLGGGWLITPALNILGIPMILAVGTALAQMSLNSFLSAIKHRKRGNLDMTLGVALSIPMIFSIQGGKYTMGLLDSAGNAEGVVSILFMVLLSTLGSFMFYESFKALITKDDRDNRSPAPIDPNAKKRWFLRGPQIKIGPNHDRPVSLIIIVILGLIAGFLSGILGIGGGFLLMPAMIYLLRVPTLIAVATSLICVMIGSFSGSISYGLSGKIEYLVVVVLLIGTIFGSQVGVAATKYVKGGPLRLLFSGVVLLSALSILMKYLNYQLVAQILIFGSATILTATILVMMGINMVKQNS
ncbi:MAG: sulfite exporter TauE/SafE family protein [Bdellovibrionales bacterium]|nr:sulfite exporter TauE/SafE family protein [Bdellovibrionales bacterium]